MLVNVPSTSFIPLAGHSMDNELAGHTSFLDEIGRLFDSHKTSVSLLPHRTKWFSDYNEARRKVKRRIEQKNKWFFMQINYLCIYYVLFVDIFTKSFDDFISMNAVFSPASLFFPTCPYIAPSPLIVFGRNLSASPFIPPSTSIWNSRVNWTWKLATFSQKHGLLCSAFTKMIQWL